MDKYTKKDLLDMQQWSLERKIQVTQTRIMEWILHYDGNVYISFSGGKDSTVLLDLVCRLYKSTPEIWNGKPLIATFINTGLEYPEIQKFIKEYVDYAESTYKIKIELNIIYPKMNFRQVIERFGYPVISKKVAGCISSARNNPDCARAKYLDGRIKTKFVTAGKYVFLIDSPFPISNYCCDKIKKEPAKLFQKETGLKPILAIMAEESKQREEQWLERGCNGFDSKNPSSNPMSFWTEQDILQYYLDTKIPYCSVYGDILKDDKKSNLYLSGCKRTGCMFCMFGIMSEKHPNRFEQMKVTHPRQYDYCINGGQYRDDGMWVPSDKGLGIGKILDYIGVSY